MKSISYYLSEMPLSKGKFMAKTLPVNTFNDEEFISEMIRDNPELSVNDIKAMLKTLIVTAERLLSKGNAISIPNFMRISPVVKGNFDSENDSFMPNKNWVDINCVILNKFINNFQQNVKVEKTDVPDKMPVITSICDSRTGVNMLRRHSANRIKGKYFIVYNAEFEGLYITLKSDPSKNIIIGKNEIEVVDFYKKEILFTFAKDFKAPEWLVENSDASLKFRYRFAGGKFMDSKAFDTKWGD